MVRDLEFDVAEISVVTFLLAKAFDKPYRLLPAVMFAAARNCPAATALIGPVRM